MVAENETLISACPKGTFVPFISHCVELHCIVLYCTFITPLGVQVFREPHSAHSRYVPLKQTGSAIDLFSLTLVASNLLGISGMGHDKNTKTFQPANSKNNRGRQTEKR